jgi:hypothetical protein
VRRLIRFIFSKAHLRYQFKSHQIVQQKICYVKINEIYILVPLVMLLF